MTDNERDTKYLDTAKLVVEALLAGPGYIEVTEPYEEVYKLIAQFIYDWTEWTIDAMKQYIYDDVTAGFESVNDVDNFTQWPESPTAE